MGAHLSQPYGHPAATRGTALCDYRMIVVFPPSRCHAALMDLTPTSCQDYDHAEYEVWRAAARELGLHEPVESYLRTLQKIAGLLPITPPKDPTR